MRWILYKTEEYARWVKELPRERLACLEARLAKLACDGYLGHSRALGDGLFELKWNDGMRVYYCFHGKQIILLLIGGFKHGQKRDIEKARRLKKAYST